ncbi:hypothetical protein M8C21_020780 [Ambrosia artemisiifolia]|uniref:Uncharacterized protein n=1 Tax=Ambrosia artemisiifolia TaxID=4212 RepID=A0AAD5GIR9_AMBAR|nr:hypothetical protein M8C21_020780 [Ambrosia artemisiifolia]
MSPQAATALYKDCLGITSSVMWILFDTSILEYLCFKPLDRLYDDVYRYYRVKSIQAVKTLSAFEAMKEHIKALYNQDVNEVYPYIVCLHKEGVGSVMTYLRRIVGSS